jgi:stress-induced-phosphoprotein 1
MTDEERAARDEKDRGTAAYKARRFDEAIDAYTKALALNPLDITLLTNRAAVHIETGDYDEVR